MTGLHHVKPADKEALNLSNKRVLKRILSAVAWAEENLHYTTPLPIPSKVINDVLGRHDQASGKFLRQHLLILHGSYRIATPNAPGWNQHYLLNKDGLDHVKGFLDVPIDSLSDVDKWRLKYKDELNMLKFNYTDKSDRLWHGLQNMPRAIKQELWQDYLPYDYDINACAPTLLVQTARAVGMTEQELEGATRYLDGKTEFRARIATLLGCDVKVAKGIINSLFNGARLNPHHTCSTFVLLNEDRTKLTALKEDAEVVALLATIKTMWQHIGVINGDKSRGHKWRIYFQLEREVINVIHRYLEQTNNKFYSEHDGWRCERAVDVVKLAERIKEATGYELSFSQNHP